MATLKAGSQILISSDEGMGKTFLINEVYNVLNREGYPVIIVEWTTAKMTLTNIAKNLDIDTKNLEGRSLTSETLKGEILQYLSVNTVMLLLDDVHLFNPQFRVWLKQLKKAGVPMMLTATHPPRTDIFINVPRLELQPLNDYAIRQLMEKSALNKGISLKNSELAKLQERVGGNPLLAERTIEEELLGIELETGDHQNYFNVTPLIALIVTVFFCFRFIGLGTGNQSLYIFSGIGGVVALGFFQAMRSLPQESKRRI